METPKVVIMDTTGKWEVNSLSMPLVTNYRNPLILLPEQMDFTDKKNKGREVDFINKLYFWEKLELCWRVLTGKKFTVKTKMLPIMFIGR